MARCRRCPGCASARAALLRPYRIPPWVGASAWLPYGRGQHTALRSLITALHRRHHQHLSRGGAPPPHWMDGRTWITAMDYDTGRRVVFGRDDVPSAPLPTDVDDIYVLAPMASTEPDHPLQPHLRLERRLRQLLTLVLLREAKKLAAQGKQVTILTPGPRDLAVMGANLRQAVLEMSLRTSAVALASLGRTAA